MSCEIKNRNVHRDYLGETAPRDVIDTYYKFDFNRDKELWCQGEMVARSSDRQRLKKACRLCPNNLYAKRRLNKRTKRGYTPR